MDLLKDNSIVSLNGNEFFPIEGKTFSQQVEEYFINQGGEANSPFGKVILDKKGIKNSKFHGMSRIKAVAFAAVKDVLEKGVVILPLKSHNIHNKKQLTGMIAAPIEISNEKYICVVEVIANLYAHRLYVHEAFIAKNLQEIVAASRVHDSNEATSLQSQGEIAKVLINYLISKYKLTDLEKLTTNISIDKEGNHKSATLRGADYISEMFDIYYNNSNYNNITMRNNNKALYESIMKDVAKVVKHKLNENAAVQATKRYKDMFYSCGDEDDVLDLFDDNFEVSLDGGKTYNRIDLIRICDDGKIHFYTKDPMDITDRISSTEQKQIMREIYDVYKELM